ncbi:hypothetical protein O181_119249, partial [Austropuccinia psidii MF-1]|nr:hypothetical protein [Austropuccinia psidii MF-1]
MDLCGPISPESCGGNRYIFRGINGHSHTRFVYLLSAKSECFEYFIKFQNLVENLKGKTIKIVVSDNGGKCFNSKLNNLFYVKGISHLPTAPYTPQQNPVYQRGNFSVIKDNSVPAEWWGGAFSMPAFVLNRTPVSSLNFVAPLTTMISPKTQWKSKINPIDTLSDFWPTHSASVLITSKEPLLLPSIPTFNFSSHKHQNPANKSENFLSVPGDDVVGISQQLLRLLLFMMLPNPTIILNLQYHWANTLVLPYLNNPDLTHLSRHPYLKTTTLYQK